MDNNNENWERETIKQIALAQVTEQRRARRWGIFFKFLGFMYLFAILALVKFDWESEDLTGEKKHTAIVDVKGLIASNTEASAEKVIKSLKAAFKDDKTAGVIVRINSPGGSPVQANYIYQEMQRLRKEYPKIPLYAVVTDLCASGGYYIAVGAEKIFVDKSSLIGSIGVVMSSFGFVNTLEKLGVERRLFTAGENKGFLDPFSPQKTEEVDHVKTLLNQLHDNFINVVKEGRGDRLQLTNEKLFSGFIWAGEEAIKLGLVDEVSTTQKVAKDLIKAEKLVNFTPRRDLFERMAEKMSTAVAEWVMFAQFGATP
ncbi:MAG: hypothetical protein RIT27_1994 [Pseudomonadota bacterium]|jgi:protease-4